jgi:DNA-binding XRE family transcriptional regulator
MSLEPDPARTDDPIEAVARFIAAISKVQAAQLRALREDAGLTQDQLARHVDFSRSTVANAEGGNLKASAEFWQRADKVLNGKGVLVARYAEMQEAVRRHAELLVRRSDAQHEADLPDGASAAEFGQDTITGAGLRISAAVLDLLTAVRESIRPDKDASGMALYLSGPTLDALHQVQEETGHSASEVADQGIQLYSYVRALLANGAEILIRAPGSEDRPMQI